jgi:hypothetical protein
MRRFQATCVLIFLDCQGDRMIHIAVGPLGPNGINVIIYFIAAYNVHLVAI